MNAEETVVKNRVVSLKYVVTTEDGEEIDRSEAGETWDYLHGHGQIVRGLEKALEGLNIGDSKIVTVEPAEGYGDYDPDDLELLPLEAFSEEVELEAGEELFLFDEDTGEVIDATIVEISEEGVLLDYNHPLAGETLVFEVEVVGIRSATAEELEHGHAHENGHHH